MRRARVPMLAGLVFALASVLHTVVAVAITIDDTPDPPCSATSNTTGTFVDLHSLTRKASEHDYLVRGHDYNTNFTLNICAPALTSKDLRFHALSDSTSSSNVSAYYKKGDSIYSLGTTSSKPKFRGKKLVLEYTGGSLCPKLGSDGQPVDGEDSKDGYRKGAILSFSCDHELIGPAVISFVGQLNDCSYHFDVKTSSACATVKQQPLGPVAIFLIIFFVALLVYFIGGCFYQRTVLHARGWRQIPHWQTWLGALNFIWEVLLVCAFSILNLFRGLVGRGRSSRSGGYSSVPGGTNGFGRGNGRARDEWGDVDDENRLIDQLDDDWSDE